MFGGTGVSPLPGAPLCWVPSCSGPDGQAVCDSGKKTVAAWEGPESAPWGWRMAGLTWLGQVWSLDRTPEPGRQAKGTASDGVACRGLWGWYGDQGTGQASQGLVPPCPHPPSDLGPICSLPGCAVAP